MHRQSGIGINRRLVLWITVAVFLIGMIGGVTGIVIFRNVLPPSQQQRIINILPFMEMFLYHPPEGYTLPTPLPSTSEFSPEDLLSVTLDISTMQITPAPTRVP